MQSLSNLPATKKRIAANWQLYALILLPLIYIIIFRYGPMYGAQIAFKNYNPIIGFKESKWVGLEYFIRFIQSPTFPKLMYNTLSLSLYSLIASFPVPILLAMGLNYVGNSFFKKTVQMATYIPNFISVVVMVGMLMQMTDIRLGVINLVIKALGGNEVYFFGKADYFRHLYVWSGVWQTAGWSSIIYLSALSGVDPELHEAAVIDGATKVQRIRYIDIPGILPTAVILFIMSFGNFMNIGFEKAFLMQNSLNISASEIIDTYVYKMGLASQTANYSYSTAIGLFQSTISFCLIMIVNKISDKVSGTSLW